MSRRPSLLSPTFSALLGMTCLSLTPAFIPNARADAPVKTAQLVSSTYLGSMHKEYTRDTAVDAQGNVYVAGDVSAATGYTLDKGKEIFVAKFSPDGKLLYHVYFGGGSDEYAYGLAVDSEGCAVVAGLTYSTDDQFTEDKYEGFPVTDNAYQKEYGRIFVARLNAAGSDLIYSTYLNGNEAQAVAVDSQDRIYITGDSNNFFKATPGAYQSKSDGYLFGAPFIVKIDPKKSGEASVVYATLLGGPNVSGEGFAIEVDAAGNAYVAGQTSGGFTATPNAAQKEFKGGFEDAFIAKMNPTGSDIVYATLLGGDDFDSADGLALDAQGNAYVTGYTYLNFPTTPNAFQKEYNLGNCSGSFEVKACSDAFVAKLDPAGSQFLYSTYLGGTYHDYGYDLVVDGEGVATVVGQTLALNFPTVNPIQERTGGANDAFVVRLNPEGSGLLFSTYLGGGSDDEADAIAVFGDRFYIAGQTWSEDFPTKEPSQDKNLGELDAFLTQISLSDEVPTPKGDVNADGQVDILDATQALRFCVDIETPTTAQFSAAEMDGDGKITVSDAIAILRKAVGLPAD